MPPVLRKLKTSKSLPEKGEIKVGYSNNKNVNINLLPFDCFHLIFGQFDLLTQILSLRTVCHVWHDHIASICASKSHLKLKPYFKVCSHNTLTDLFMLPDLRQFPKNLERKYLQFRLPKIAKLTTNSSLFSLFAANLTSLSLAFDRWNWGKVNINVANVTKLMKSFSKFSNLRTLSLCTECGTISYWDNNQLIQILQSLYKAIGDCVTRGKLPKLKHLNLIIEVFLNSEAKLSDHEMHLDPHFLSQLEHFSMDFPTRNVPELLGQLNPNLTFLGLNCAVLLPSDLDFDPALLGEPKFAPHLTHLCLNRVSSDQLKLFCNRFRALQSVQLAPARSRDECFNANWIEPLNQLEQLVELRLHGFNVTPLESRKCLSRVKMLTWYHIWLLSDFAVEYCGEFDGELFCRTVARQFPNLEELVMLSHDSIVPVKRVRDHLSHFKKLRSNFLNFGPSRML